MDPRDLIRAFVRIVFAMLFAVAPAVAGATVNSIAVHPPEPTTCDPVTLTAHGSLDGCDSLVSREVSGPEPIPDWAGPLPAYQTRIQIRIKRDLPPRGCIAIVRFYAEEFPMGQLPFGQHFVTATERIYDPDGALLDSSIVSNSFAVTRRDSCDAEPCALLSFTTPGPPSDGYSCDAVATPGSYGSFRVALGSPVPVGGVQLRIQITGDGGQVLPAGWFVPTLVSTTPRSTGMQIAWEADGSAANVMLFSTSGATIPPGHEPILRVVYSVASNVPAGVYAIRFEQSLVADAQGNEIPHCPTFREALGRFCVGQEQQGCDLDGDGVADIRDVIRLVRCALAGEACPDTIAAHADCNTDGHVDVRDVICCVRKLLAFSPQRAPILVQPSGWTPLRIGFTGDASWATPLQGRATIAVEPGTNFGGVEFQVAPSTSVRITDLGVNTPGYLLEWGRDFDGRARAVLLRQGPVVEAVVLPVPRVTVTFERIGSSGSGSGELRLENIHHATWDAEYAAHVVTAGAALIPAAGAVPAPAVYAARPNPFAGTTEIPYALPAAGRVALRIFDVSGRLVRTLVDGERPAGSNRAAWDGKDGAGRPLPAGIYFAQLRAAGVERTSRIMKLR